MKWRRRLAGSWRVARIAAIFAAVPFACAVAVWSSRTSDDAILRDKALAITAGLTSTSARIWAINDWVYHNQGFGKNNRYFIVPALGATPLQIMQSGGDCADKSRLVSAMLNEIGIKAGLVMLYPCEHCGPIHTVVEARDENGSMVVDPIWDVDYPSGDGRFFGVRELAGTRLGLEHREELQQQSAIDAKIRRMPPSEATFDYTAAVNWNKNPETRAVAFALQQLGYAPESLMRPQVLEDPKLALTLFLMTAGVGLVVFGAAIGFAFPGLAGRFGLPAAWPLRRARSQKRSIPAR
jgi:hypothetical protein